MKDLPNQRPLIKCPHCGHEYLLGEIFIPNNLVGQPDSVVRDALGKILYEDYLPDKEWDPTETYICDNCNKTFVVEATISVKVKKEEEEIDFSNQYSSLI